MKENNLLIKNHNLCQEWDYKKNEFGPENYLPNSHKEVWWICKKCNNEWISKISGRNKGNGCPYCSGRKTSKENNLLFLNPKLCEEWDYEKNEFGPENYTCGSGKPINWVCKNNHEWVASINNRTNHKYGCPYCSGHRISKENNLLVKNHELCQEWDYKKNEFGPENYALGSNKKVWWTCKKCKNEWESTISNRNNGRGCPYCAGRKVSKENNLLVKNPKLCKDWSNKNELGPENYTPCSNKKVFWACKKCNEEWKTTISHRNNGRGCPFCSGRYSTKENNLSATNPELCEEWSNKNTPDTENYMSNSNKKVWWTCKKCDNEWEAVISDRNRGSGCPYCAGRRISKENNLLFLNPKLCEEWDYEKNEFRPENYSLRSGKKINWVCKNGHNWVATIDKRSSGRDCPYCSKSVSKLSQVWLESLNIPNLKREYLIKVGGKNFKVDGIEINSKIVYEYLGDYWHGNPLKYGLFSVNKSVGRTFGDLLYDTIVRFNLICEGGFEIFYSWESDKEIYKYTPIYLTKKEIFNKLKKTKAPNFLEKLIEK